MEIRNSFVNPATQTIAPRQTTPAQAPPQADTERNEQGEDVREGELLTRSDTTANGATTDYGDLIRAARQQQTQPTEQRTIPEGGQSPQAARAAAAYQSNGETPAATEQRQTINNIV